MSECWVLCRDTTGGEYSDATEPVTVFVDEQQAKAALEEHARMRAATIRACKEHWTRRSAETPQPHGYNWNERDNVGTPTHAYWAAVAAWDAANGMPPDTPPEHTLVKVPLRGNAFHGTF